MSDESTEPKPLKLKLSRTGDSSPGANTEASEGSAPRTAPEEVHPTQELPRSAQLRVRSRAERQQASEASAPEAPEAKPEAPADPAPGATDPAVLPDSESLAERPRPVLKRRPDPEPEIEPEIVPDPKMEREVSAVGPLGKLTDDPAVTPAATPTADPITVPPTFKPFEQVPVEAETEPESVPEPEPAAPAENPPSSAEEPAPAPPPLRKPTSPDPESGSGDVETATDRLGQKEGAQAHSPWLSIAIIVVLLGILGGAGYGIWYLLLNPSDTPASADATNAPATPATSPASLIDSAQSAIDARPTAAMEAVLAVDTAAATTDAASPRGAPAAAAPTTTPRQTGDDSLVSAVSAYLSGIHIGGMRTTDRPMVIINGKNYNAGDTVDPDTGLRFSGIHNGKLAFTDKNGVAYLKSF